MSIWKELKHRVEKGVETASQKSQQMVEISRLNLRIRGKKEDINRLYRRLGILVYEAWNGDEGESLVLSENMKEILHLIRQFQAEITALEQELLSVRGKVDCPECGAVFDRGAKICPVCQAPNPHATSSSPDDRDTAAEPQASDASSQQRHPIPPSRQPGLAATIAAKQAGTRKSKSRRPTKSGGRPLCRTAPVPWPSSKQRSGRPFSSVRSVETSWKSWWIPVPFAEKSFCSESPVPGRTGHRRKMLLGGEFHGEAGPEHPAGGRGRTGVAQIEADG